MNNSTESCTRRFRRTPISAEFAVAGAVVAWTALSGLAVAEEEPSTRLEVNRAQKSRQVVGSGWESLTLNHIVPVKSVAFRPDGKHIASAGGNIVKLWDAVTGHELLTLKGVGFFRNLVFSPDGKRLASASSASEYGWRPENPDEIKLWDADTGEELLTLKHAQPGATPDSRISFSPDGNQLTAMERESSTVWDLTTGEELTTTKIGFVESSADATRLAGGGWQGSSFFLGGPYSVRVWNANTGHSLLSLISQGTRGIALSPDGQRLATAGDDKTIKLWDVDSKKQLLTIQGRDKWIDCMRISPDAKRLAAAYSQYGAAPSGEVWVWDAATGQVRFKLRHAGYISSIAFSPDSQRLASASDTTVKVWTLAGQELLRMDGPSRSGHGNKVAFSPDGRRLASGGSVWDATTGKEVLSVPAFCMAISPDGKRLASASGDVAKVWDAATGEVQLTLWEHNFHSVLSVAFSPSGKRLASSCSEKTVRVWDAATGKRLLSLLGHRYGVNCVAFSPDGKRLASAGEDQTVKLWDSTTGQELRTLRHNGPAVGVAFSADGKQLASASKDQTVKLWDPATGQTLRTLRHSGPMLSVALSADGKRLAAGTDDKLILVWDAATGQHLLTMQGNNSSVAGVAFSPEGTRLASAGDDGTVMVWSVRDGRGRER